jgi:hypothetical protein
MIRERHVDLRSALAEQTVTFHFPLATAFTASTTGICGFRLEKNVRIKRIGFRSRAKNNSDNTVTLTLLNAGNSVGTLAVPSGAAPQVLVSADFENDADSVYVAGSAITVNTGAFAGTAPSFTDADVWITYRVAGTDLLNV